MRGKKQKKRRGCGNVRTRTTPMIHISISIIPVAQYLCVPQLTCISYPPRLSWSVLAWPGLSYQATRYSGLARWGWKKGRYIQHHSAPNVLVTGITGIVIGIIISTMLIPVYYR